MDLSVDYLVDLSESWLPVVLQYGAQVTLALLTLLLGWWLINILTARVSGLLQRRRVDPTLHGFVGSLASIALRVLLLVSVASMVGVETTSFIAVIGAAGLAIGLALQGSLANFAGGVLILLFRPFRVGEWIEAQGVSGTVNSIQIFHTVLKTGDNKTVVVPNGALSNGHITNFERAYHQLLARAAAPCRRQCRYRLQQRHQAGSAGPAGNRRGPARAARPRAGRVRYRPR